MKRKRLLIIVVALALIMGLLAAGCAKHEAAPRSKQMDMAMEAPADKEYQEESYEAEGQGVLSNNQSEQGKTDGQTLQEKIIYNVSMTLTCEDVSVALEKLTNQVVALGGYVQRSDMSKSGDDVYANITVRVPSAHLSDYRSFAKKVGEVDHSNMYTDNVTMRYYDIKGRLKVAREEKEQILKVLDKAEEVEDILKVRAELTQIQERIESFEGQIRMWDSLVDYSTVDFNLRPKETLDTTEDGPRLIGLGETGRALMRNLKNTAIHVANFFSFLVRNLPVLIIIGIIVAIVLLIVRRAKRRKKPTPSSDSTPNKKQ